MVFPHPAKGNHSFPEGGSLEESLRGSLLGEPLCVTEHAYKTLPEVRHKTGIIIPDRVIVGGI